MATLGGSGASSANGSGDTFELPPSYVELEVGGQRAVDLRLNLTSSRHPSMAVINPALLSSMAPWSWLPGSMPSIHRWERPPGRAKR